MWSNDTSLIHQLMMIIRSKYLLKKCFEILNKITGINKKIIFNIKPVTSRHCFTLEQFLMSFWRGSKPKLLSYWRACPLDWTTFSRYDQLQAPNLLQNSLKEGNSFHKYPDLINLTFFYFRYLLVKKHDWWKENWKKVSKRLGKPERNAKSWWQI